MKWTTEGSVFCQEVKTKLQVMDISVEKLLELVTDGMPSMVGTNSGASSLSIATV
jgi:hypothetical protein